MDTVNETLKLEGHQAPDSDEINNIGQKKEQVKQHKNYFDCF